MKKLKVYLFHGVWVLVLTLLLCGVVKALSFSTMFLDPVGQALNGFRFTDTYFYVQNNNEKNVDYNPDILLFDISGCYSRTEIAAALQRINDCRPKAIGMDVIFGTGGVQDSVTNDSLLRVVKSCDRLVTAMRIVQTVDGLDIEHSFYAKESGCVEASVNVENETVRNFGVTVKEGDLEVPSFVGEIIRMAYPEMYKKFAARGNDAELINYKSMEFDKIHIYDGFSEFDIEDRVVLIGDFEDLRDYHGVPVMVDGCRRIPGTKIHAFAISTVTKNRIVNQMSDKAGMILGLLITFLFSVLCCRIFLKYDKISGLLINSYQLALLLLYIVVGGVLFVDYRYNINLLYTMLGTGLVGFTAELWFCFTLSKVYKKTIGRLEPGVL